jgi:hypothetical protein
MPQSASRLKHVLDHIIARQHGGLTNLENLALCCGQCNAFKGPNIAGIDPDTGSLTRLFHPINDRWDQHFRIDQGVIEGISAVGRATVEVLAMNLALRVSARRYLMRDGLWD